MADSEVLAAVKTLQTQFEGQTIAIHQTLQQYMSTVDSRLEDLRSQIQGSSSVLAASSGSAHRSSVVAEGHSGHTDLSPVLRSKDCVITVTKKDTTELAMAEPFEEMVTADISSLNALAGQGYVFTLDLFVLPIEGPDVVLGIQWLQRLGRVSHQYAAMTMDFYWDGTPVSLRGNVTNSPSLITFNQFQALMHSTTVQNLFELQQLHSDQDGGPGDLELSISLPSPISHLLHKFHNLFHPPTGLPPHRFINHRIHLLSNTNPVNVRPYRYPHFQKTEMEKLIREMLEQGVIKPSHSPFSSPVLLVKKKDGTYRFCVDYRALNAVTIKDKFPIPTIDELLDELGGATIFSKLDLRAGYHQIRVHNRDTYKTTFRTHEGHYEFLVMPFGLTNAPSTFQATMNQIFATFLRKFVIVFFDDILVYSSSLADHVSHLEQVLSCLHSNCFFIKLSKCFFCQETVEYLGHLVSAEAVRADPQKIAAMVNWPPPTSLKQLRGFLGLTGYYRPTTAFEALKQAMVEAPVLRLPNFELDFIIETDASNVGIGAVLMQDNHPISYYSKKLGPKLQVASTYIKELHAIVEAVHKWRQYLLGRFFIIRTDHKSIKELLQQVIQTPDQQVYIRKLLGYHFKIEYKPGQANQAADALSRVHEDEPVEAPKRYSAYLPLVSGPTFDLLATLRLDNTTCPDLVLLHKRLAAAACLTCQQIKHSTQTPAGLLQPLPIPSLVWDEVTMDFITGLPPSRGLTTILVVVDRLTKSAHFGALSSQFSVVTAADLFANMVVKLHGFPSSIVSDRDPIFMSKFWKKLFELSGTSLRHNCVKMKP
ncbi:hypothetical protein KPL71_026005 [Citrus sinensis]|uniref:Uncharacterized protein n=1 Tax=Citrus sinensis TaxID=2711 RepID=A0ACB8HX44_CITSI|nr:hypothetical protein KPL71_026005 [Citrus sinensis]